MALKPENSSQEFEQELAQLSLLNSTDHFKKIQVKAVRQPIIFLSWAFSIILVLGISAVFFWNQNSNVLPGKSDLIAQINIGTSQFLLGEHYFEVSTPETSIPTSALTENAALFFSYSCEYCSQLNTYLSESNILSIREKSIQHIPAIWSEPMRYQAKIYYTAEFLGIELKARGELYEMFQSRGIDAGNFEKIAAIFLRHGVDSFLFEKTFNSPAIQEKMQFAELSSKYYAVNSIPMIIVNQKYSITPNSANGADAMLEITGVLLETREDSSCC